MRDVVGGRSVKYRPLQSAVQLCNARGPKQQTVAVVAVEFIHNYGNFEFCRFEIDLPEFIDPTTIVCFASLLAIILRIRCSDGALMIVCSWCVADRLCNRARMRIHQEEANTVNHIGIRLVNHFRIPNGNG